MNRMHADERGIRSEETGETPVLPSIKKSQSDSIVRHAVGRVIRWMMIALGEMLAQASCRG